MPELRRVLRFIAEPVVAVVLALALGTLLVGWAYLSTRATPAGATALVAKGPITETVNVPATIEAAHETSLAFEASGRVAAITVAVGDHVAAGQVLVSLDAGNQSAAVAAAQATLRMKQADLASLEAGTRPEDLAAAEAAVVAAVESAYVATDDAVHNRADLIFNYPDQSPTLIFANDGSLKATVEKERGNLTTLFKDWQAAIGTLGNDNAAAVAAASEKNLVTVETFLDNASIAVSEALPGQADPTTLAADKSSIATGRTNVAAAAAALAAAASTLTIKSTAASAEDIAAASAAVDAAQAAVAAAEATLGGTVLVAPVAGTITVQDANLGQTVVPGSPLVSMIADGKYQAVAQVAETDIAKVKVGDVATASLDAYPGAAFTGRVTTVDPAASVAGGVSSYGVTITFDADDTRLAAGLPANLSIVTNEKPEVLSVPVSAVITDGSQAFVYVKGPSGPVKTPVTTGIRSAAGAVEISSGLTEGERVLAYGASAS
ncbi:MAG: efflux RND transporter periplasmic adaptor subunit [Patescibacteria group bacterium]|nr:efflux RND transporter periplasmic adaptor subunit [Patescibacteria group bacterium]